MVIETVMDEAILYEPMLCKSKKVSLGRRRMSRVFTIEKYSREFLIDLTKENDFDT